MESESGNDNDQLGLKTDQSRLRSGQHGEYYLYSLNNFVDQWMLIGRAQVLSGFGDHWL